MGNASFVQTSFLGGEWSPRAQGRMAEPAYKTALNVCRNALPTEEGAWVRRSGFKFMAHTKGGQTAKIAAFDFTITQPYQIEFTNLNLRMYAGLSLVTMLEQDGTVFVNEVLNTNPCKVVLASAVPGDWANGQTVIFRLPSVPCTCPRLLNRQFVIANLDTVAQTFTLKDPITNADIDATAYGNTLTPSGAAPDTVERIMDLTTVYPTAILQSLRLVTNDTTALILSGSYKPYQLQQDAPWSLVAQDFTDGPYFDINKTTTTLTPSGTTGSITVTASSIVGINDGVGFKTTDVGRLIRIQTTPAAYDAGTTYAKDAVVTGSDSNIYVSVAGANIGHDPTTDTGSFWVISSTTVLWTWLKITARGSATSVTATVMGDDLSTSSATTQWRLGLYSDTTGWPSVGVFHEGRLWLSSTAFGNRVDGSVSNDQFNFAPSAADGTVGAANAVAAIANAKDVNYFFWMISTEDGLILGSQSGEWRVRASSLDDPISPTSIQMRRVSNWGCANCEPVQASQNVFVQRQRRKILAHKQLTDQKYGADNLSHLADHLISDGVAEIAWQQEPSLTIWSRTQTGGLVGMVFQKDFEHSAETFNAFYSVDLGDGRVAESISSGPTFDGLSTALYVVTNQTNVSAPDYNVRWVQTVMPVFDTQSKDWEAYFVDGGANPSYAQRFAIANGDSFDGIRIHGLWNLNGRTAAIVMGGLDLGDRNVTNGYADVPFLSDPDKVFSVSFFTGLSNGTDYGIYQSQVSYTNTSSTAASGIAFFGSYAESTGPVPQYLGTYLAGSGNTLSSQWGLMKPVDTTSTSGEQLLGLVGPDADVTGSNNVGVVDWIRNQFIMINYASGGVTEGFRLLDITTGDEITELDGASFPGGAIPSGIAYIHRNGFLYMSGRGGNTNSAPISKIDPTTFAESAFYGVNSSSLAGSTSGRLQLAFGTMAGPIVSGHNYLVFAGIRSASVANEVTFVDADGGMNFLSATQITEDSAFVCNGRETTSFAAVVVLGTPSATFWPALFAIGTTYGSGVFVFGSNGKVYKSLAGSNVGNDPTTDGGVHWSIQPDPFSLYEFTIPGYAKRKIVTFGPKDIDSTWTTVTQSLLIGPAYDISSNAAIFYAETADAVTNKKYLFALDMVTGAFKWKTILPTTFLVSYLQFAEAVIHGHFSIFHASGANYTVYNFNMTDGTYATQTWNAGFSGISTQRFGSTITTGEVTYTVPISVGASYTSRGQLLRPDFGPDAGAQNGPAFGKLRRIHKYAVAFFKSRGVSVGTIFGKLFPVALRTPGKSVISAPTLYSGVISDTIQNDDSYDAQIAWEITRPYPATILAAGGYIQSSDK